MPYEMYRSNNASIHCELSISSVKGGPRVAGPGLGGLLPVPNCQIGPAPLSSISASSRRPKPSPTTTFPCTSADLVFLLRQQAFAKLNCKRRVSLHPGPLSMAACCPATSSASSQHLQPEDPSSLSSYFCLHWELNFVSFFFRSASALHLPSKRYYICSPRY